ncbi:MAG: ABC transporter transmembrane domain-containing protein [Phycisphaerae bacterium]
MPSETRSAGWLADFRRSLGYIGPHRRTLILGLLAALGVGFFYTFSLSSVIPMLKVIFADHESLADWVHRIETERRLGVRLAGDLPDDPDGLFIEYVKPDSPAEKLINPGTRLVAVNGEPINSYALMRQVTIEPGAVLARVTVQSYDVQRKPVRREVDLPLAPYRGWTAWLRNIAEWLPQSKDVESRVRTLAFVMAGLVGATFFGGIFRLANEGLVATAVQRGMHDFRSSLAEHVLRLPMEWHASRPPGDTLGRFATDMNKVETGLNTVFGKTIREPIKATGVLILTAMIDWQLLLVALAGVPVGAVVMGVFGGMIKKAQKRASKSWGVLLDHLGERLAGIRVVKAYGMQQAEAAKFEHEGRTLTRAQTQIEIVDAATNPALEVLAMSGVAAFVIFGGVRVFSGDLEPQLFFAATICLAGVFDPLRKMGNVYNRAQAADAAARRLFELLDVPEEEPERRTDLPELPRFRDKIVFENVTFAYPNNPDRNVLSDVSLTILQGQVVAVVGPNGCGKTTLMSLLLRFYAPASGRILIDGHDIARVRLDTLRQQIGLVTQDAVVFSDTVSGNIAYGATAENSAQRVDWAAQQAHADDFVARLRSLEGGIERVSYDALVTARQLSGGQRQRIALARAIFRDPPILVLDEATSQIDTESEEKIQQALEEVTRDRTTIIIAHRFSTISRADKIVVMNDGQIVACGTHAELIRTSPFYEKLCQTQFATAT